MPRRRTPARRPPSPRTCVAAPSGPTGARGSPETRGVGGQALPVGADVACQLGELGGQAPRSLGQASAPGSSRAASASAFAADAAASPTEPSPASVSSASVERSSSRSTCASRASSTVEPFRLAVARVHGLDLADLVGQQVELPFAVARRASSASSAERHRATAPTPRDTRRGRRRCASPANRSRNPVWVVDDSSRCASCCPWTSTSAPAELRERGDGRELSADAGAALPVGVDRPGQDDLAVLGPFTGARGAHRTAPGRVRPSRRRGRASVGPGPQRQREAHGHHGLAGAGLSGEDVQAGMQLEVEVVDDPETADVQLAEHPRTLSRGTDIAVVVGIRRVARQVELVPDASEERRRVLAADQPRRPLRRADPRTRGRPAARRSPGRRRTAARAPRRGPRAITCWSAPSTNERSNTMCAAIGVSDQACDVGATIGPPAENE